MSKAEWKRIDEGLERLAVEGAVAQARALMGGETVNPDVENWEPYEEDDDQGEPVEPFYTERSLRERMERKAARQPRKDRTE